MAFVKGTPTILLIRALWRSYYKAAERILEVYAQGKLGIDAIAYQMQIEGWPFRDR
jgi:hypothetical protein